MLRILFRLIRILLLLVVLALFAFRVAAYLRESQDPAALVPTFPDQGAVKGVYIETGDTRFFTLTSGPPSATPVLLAHGTAAWSGFWKAEVEQLGATGDYYTIAFDMPPFGFSSRAADRDYSRARQARRILDLVATLDAPPIMVAHSFGAAAATEAVLSDPTAFKGLIIVDGALGMDPSPTEKSLPVVLRPRVLRETAMAASVTNPLATKRLMRGLLYNKDAATQTYADILQLPQRQSGTTAAYADWLPALLSPATDTLSRDPARYRDLPIPVAIIWGDQDSVTPPAQAEALAAALGQGDVIYLKDVGHIPHIEAPEAFMKALLDALAAMP